MLWVLICLEHLTVSSHHVTHLFQSESTISSFPNLKDVFAKNSRDTQRLGECSGIQTHNHLVCKRPMNYLIKLATWLTCYKFKPLLRIWPHVPIMSNTRLRPKSHFIFTFKMRSFPLERRATSEDSITSAGFAVITTYFVKEP